MRRWGFTEVHNIMYYCIINISRYMWLAKARDKERLKRHTRGFETYLLGLVYTQYGFIRNTSNVGLVNFLKFTEKITTGVPYKFLIFCSSPWSSWWIWCINNSRSHQRGYESLYDQTFSYEHILLLWLWSLLEFVSGTEKSFLI